MDTKIKAVKQSFFAYRNGIVADVLKRAGSPFSIIFGLTIPQISDIAKNIGTDPILADALWSDTHVRESMMLAPMLADASTMTVTDAVRWSINVPSTEIADILVLKLLRHVVNLNSVASELCASDMMPMQRYIGLRAAFSLLATEHDYVKSLAKAELDRNEPLTSSIARQLLEQ